MNSQFSISASRGGGATKTEPPSNGPSRVCPPVSARRTVLDSGTTFMYTPTPAFRAFAATIAKMARAPVS